MPAERCAGSRDWKADAGQQQLFGRKTRRLAVVEDDPPSGPQVTHPAIDLIDPFDRLANLEHRELAALTNHLLQPKGNPDLAAV